MRIYLPNKLIMIKANDVIIAYSTNRDTRHRATSGGVGSAVIQYLFKKNIINSSISFTFNSEELRYEPQIIYSQEEYSISGSIYHEINLINFIKSNIHAIKSPIALFALPCQVAPIKNTLHKNGIESFIIELTCSSQQSYEATEYLLKHSNIKKSDVAHIQYRGNGWPGGVRITLKDGREHFFHNNSSVWTKIFHSHLFIQPRCFLCSNNKPRTADLVIADPWSIDTYSAPAEGRTLCVVNSDKMAMTLNRMEEENLVQYETGDSSLYTKSQYGTIVRKDYNQRHKKVIKAVKNIIQGERYKKNILSSKILFNAHCSIYRIVFKILHKIFKIHL